MPRLTNLSFLHHFRPSYNVLLYSTVTTRTDSFANYLVDSLGFSHHQALSASTTLFKLKKVYGSKFVANATSVLTFFRHYGFDDTHLVKIVSFNPKVLCINVEKTLSPKIKMLHTLGFSESDLIRVVFLNPNILFARSDSSILPAVLVLRRLLVCDANVIAVLGKFLRPRFSGVVSNMMPNVDLLIGYGIPVDLIRKYLVQRPEHFLRDPVKLEDIVIRVEKKLGIPRKSRVFLYGIHLLSNYTEENIESKCRLFKSFGWTQSDVETLMMKNPFCFSFSDARIKKTLEFLMNELQLKPAYLIPHSALFTCSLEKRIMPRYKVLVILKEKGLLKKNPSLNRAICMSESRFLEMFVLPFEEIHKVYAEHTGMKKLTKEISVTLSTDSFRSYSVSSQAKGKGYSTSAFSSDAFAKYVVNALDFSKQQALSVSKRLSQYRKVKDFNFEANATSVVTLFRHYGFQDTHIRKIVASNPRVLCSNVENTIEPKLKFLQNRGFSRSDLHQLISANPDLFSAGLESSISPAFEILRQVLGCDTLVVVVMKKLCPDRFSSVCNNLLPNVALLNNYRIPIEFIRKHLVQRPEHFLQDPVKFKDILTRVEKKLRIRRDSRVFLDGIGLLSDCSEKTIKSKFQMFKSFGWTQRNVNTFMMKNPTWFAFSDRRIRKRLEFLRSNFVFSSRGQLKRIVPTDAFANYLVNSLGFTQQQAFSASKRLSQYRKVNDFNFDTNATSVVTFFKNTLCPKLKFLHAKGFSGSELIRVISMNPNLLLSRSESSILSAVQILRQVLVCDTHVLAVLPKLCVQSIYGVTEYLIPNIDLLTSYGIPVELIRQHICHKPLVFLQNPEIFKDIVIRIEKILGISPGSPTFVNDILLLSGRCKDTIESGCRMFKSFGWTQTDVDTFMLKNVSCFTFSDASIKKKLDFLMSELQLTPAYLVRNPVFFTYSLEKRIVPRHQVLLILRERCLLNKNPSLNSVIRMSESRFLDMFVMPFKEVHEAYAKHTGCSMKTLTQERADNLKFSTSPDSFVTYLVQSLGFSHQQAVSTSAKLSKSGMVNDFNFDSNALSVVTFFKKYGFDDTQLTKIVSFDPRVLCSNVKNTIEPRLKFLRDQGFSRSDLIWIISANPRLLLTGVDSFILDGFHVLRQVLVCDAHAIAVIKKIQSLNSGEIIKNMMPNVDLLTSYGIPIELIRKHIIDFPETFSRNPEKLKDIVIRVEKALGIPRDAPMFLYGVYLLCRYTEENIKSKCHMFKSFGWTQSDVETLMMRNPRCFTLSSGSIKKKLDYLMNELQLEPAYLTHKSAFFTCNLEKRIMPRHKVLSILKEKGLLKRDISLISAICMTESRFLGMFVVPFKEVHESYAKRLSILVAV